ncbi:subtilisin-like protease SBT5.3 [Phragmites australis]|uniref:subtilisin-like protease SBT5.3 n=1 Tax=Phragmites australis TaxID=29695 RepID=UPI002D77276D|nr:subtilisin-like protease SBT5.3 [Phragmites australis]
MGSRGGRVFLLALVLALALQTQLASAAKQPYLIIWKDSSQLTPSPSAVFSPLTNDYQILYVLDPIHGIVVHIDDVFVPLLRQLPGVLTVIPDTLIKLHTTHSWDFLGLGSDGQPTPAWYSAGFGKDTIIGNIDTGVWPESESFKDDGLPVPSKWNPNVTCNPGEANPKYPPFKCNSKLIGARFFSASIQALGALDDGGQRPSKEDLSSPRDYVGHGSHTLSTAGGGSVPGASVFGHGMGRAAGGSPSARVAAYKACYAPGCSSFDILAAILAAVADGVDVLSLSLGSDPSDYLMDPIAIGAFFAVQKGVTVVCSAGNSGPQPSTVTNVAPWIFTVAASTMDRDFPAYVNFGGNTIEGQSLGDSTLPSSQAYPIISGENANAANQPTVNSTLCLPGSLDPAKVSGKIVVCVRGVNARVEKGFVVKQAGGVGMVLCNDASSGDDVNADPHLIAAAHCSYAQCVQLFKYLQFTDNPSGYINATDASFGVKPAPKMAAFSSRGPNPITPQILKPDITAPGVSVIAAYSGAISPTGQPFDDRRIPYNRMSGTSMSCPHVSGIVGLLKTKYPTWSPAMIKSAIMTTATTGDNNGSSIQDETGAAATPFIYGSGHVNPVQALDPGLVYDTTFFDYVNFLCSALKPTQNPLPGLPVNLPLLLPLFNAASEPCTCSKGAFFRPEELNYPSIAVPCLSGSTAVKRRVKNVGAAPGTYTASVTEPQGVRVTVVPNVLYFGIGEEKEFTVKLDVVNAAAAADYVFGSIEWSDSYGKHRVRSPIVAKTRCG